VRYAPPGSSQAFAEAIRRALDERQESSVLAQRARERARRYSWDKCAAETVEVYRTLTEQPRRGRLRKSA
jgi:glycosyltransferase involved in cell wall biosynthesis